jgi:LL-H family phage holin
MTWDQFMALVPSVLTLLVAAIMYGYQLLLAHLPEARRQRLQALAGAVVTAVEQTGRDQNGVQKKAAAVKLLGQLASDFHIPVSATLLDVLIEAAVAALPATAKTDPAPLPAT